MRRQGNGVESGTVNSCREEARGNAVGQDNEELRECI